MTILYSDLAVCTGRNVGISYLTRSTVKYITNPVADSHSYTSGIRQSGEIDINPRS